MLHFLTPRPCFFSILILSLALFSFAIAKSKASKLNGLAQAFFHFAAFANFAFVLQADEHVPAGANPLVLQVWCIIHLLLGALALVGVLTVGGAEAAKAKAKAASKNN